MNDDINARPHCVDRIRNSVVSLIIGEIDDDKLLGTKPIDVASLMVKSALLQHDEDGIAPARRRALPERHR